MKPTITKLKKKLDALVSECVRRRAADFSGMAQCVTCPTLKPWKEMQCGHYVSRSHLSVRWDLRNCHVQCFVCNMKFNGCKAGNYPMFSKYLIEQNGVDWLLQLIKDGEKIKQWKLQDLQNEIEHFKELLVSL